MNYYKFTLKSDLIEYCELLQGYHFVNNWLLIADGHIVIKKGYAWNGCTGAIDTDKTYIASCIHDILYQFRVVLRKLADKIFNYFLKKYKFCLRKIYYFAVRLFGWFFY